VVSGDWDEMRRTQTKKRPTCGKVSAHSGYASGQMRLVSYSAEEFDQLHNQALRRLVDAPTGMAAA
jgi:hypothetical protein